MNLELLMERNGVPYSPVVEDCIYLLTEKECSIQEIYGALEADNREREAFYEWQKENLRRI